MAGSQLKTLKAALKAKGLVGQTNVKRKNKKVAPLETRRDAERRQNELSTLRTQFNQFDTRFNRTKHDYSVILKGKFVKAGSAQHNETAKSNLAAQEALRTGYQAHKQTKNRSGGVVDRRFGERNKHMTDEEKMLERFTRERQSAAKRLVFSLDSDDENRDDDDDDGFALTHGGQRIGALNGDDGAADRGFFDQESSLGDAKSYTESTDDGRPQRRKTKKEVMAEVIAKSKFHKKQRQLAFQRTQEEIMDLDDEFGAVMSAAAAQRGAAAAPARLAADAAYDAKVRELTYDRRAVPADRTKTAEEIAAEHRERMEQLEQARQRRMTGGDASGGADGGDADDLDDFWHQSDGGSDAEAENDASGAESDPEREGRAPAAASAPLPASAAALGRFLAAATSPHDAVARIEAALAKHHPRLAEGNKQRCAEFLALLLLHVVAHGAELPELVLPLVKLLRRLAGQHNEALVAAARAELEATAARVVVGELAASDAVLFSTLGYIFSASDHYHLVLTPTALVMAQYVAAVLAQRHVTPAQLGYALLVCDVVLTFQSYARRYVPEVAGFLRRAMGELRSRVEISDLVTDLENRNVVAPAVVRIADIESRDDAQHRLALLRRAVGATARCLALWKDQTAAAEIFAPLAAEMALVAELGDVVPAAASTAEQLRRVVKNGAHLRPPLALQAHRLLAIETRAPKFEENFNPDKKSYDENRDRQEMAKVQAQLKKEKKAALKDLRHEARFVARQQATEKKVMYGAYHKKMASIVNSISTEEGREANEYDRERKRRKQ